MREYKGELLPTVLPPERDSFRAEDHRAISHNSHLLLFLIRGKELCRLRAGQERHVRHQAHDETDRLA